MKLDRLTAATSHRILGKTPAISAAQMMSEMK